MPKALAFAIPAGGTLATIAIVAALWTAMTRMRRRRAKSVSLRETFLLNAVVVATALTVTTLLNKLISRVSRLAPGSVGVVSEVCLDANVAIASTFVASFAVYALSGGDNPV